MGGSPEPPAPLSVTTGAAGIGVIPVVGIVSPVRTAPTVVVRHLGVNLVRLPGALVGLPAQTLCIGLALFCFLAQPFGVNLGLLGFRVRAGCPRLPLARIEVLGMRFFTNLVGAIVILPALLLIVCVLALPAEENDQSDDEQHHEDPDDDPYPRHCVHCLRLPREGLPCLCMASGARKGRPVVTLDLCMKVVKGWGCRRNAFPVPQRYSLRTTSPGCLVARLDTAALPAAADKGTKERSR